MLVLKIVLEDTRRFDRVYEDIEVSIGGIESIQTIMVIKDIDYKLILGYSFFYNIQLMFLYNNEKYQCARFINKDRSKIGVTCVCYLQGKAQREARIIENKQLVHSSSSVLANNKKSRRKRRTNSKLLESMCSNHEKKGRKTYIQANIEYQRLSINSRCSWNNSIHLE